MLTIAIVQKQWSDDLQSELRTAIRRIKICGEYGARLICFSELAFRPWFVANRPSKGETAKPLPETFRDALGDASKRFGVCVNYSDIERVEETVFNANKFIEPSGEIFSSYKRHVPNTEGFYEASWFQADDKPIRSIETSIGTIGLLLCSDLMFPEEARSLGAQGADLILAPRSASKESISRWIKMISANATVSGAYVVSANRIGNDSGVDFSGNSCITEPGGALSSLMGQDEGMLFTTLDLSKARAAKTDYPIVLN